MTYNIIYYETLGSTNDEAKKLAADGRPEGTVVISGAQTSGRGRLGKSWSSPASRGLYMSVVLRPQAPDVMKITVMAAVAVSRALDADIKWPNDIFINGKKVCGILTETTSAQNGAETPVILGIGVNVSNEDFPDELKKTATSLSIERRSGNNRETSEKILDCLADVYEIIKSGGFDIILREYKQKCVTIGRRAVFLLNGKQCEGTAADIARDGGLVVDCGSGSVTLRSGEVRLV